MSNYCDIRFIPTKWSANILQTLYFYAEIVDKNCRFGKGEERESSHYIGDTYINWKNKNCEIKLYWCDEVGAEDWICISIDCEDGDALKIGNKISKFLNDFSESLHIN